jgi:hypothetical protein
MFLGTVPLYDFDYATVEQFARRAAQILIDDSLPIRHVTTTNHGVGVGLDPCEALQYLIAGVMAAAVHGGLGMLERVTIVERDRRRSESLKKWLIDNWPETSKAKPLSSDSQHGAKILAPRIRGSIGGAMKGHVFVAMPFSDEFEDVYEFGIYAPVRAHGYACEHVGQAAFTGDVLERIRVRIETAELMIADLTNGRPNVYLEVGYAWGRNIPTIIVARSGEQLHFDVSRHRCIFYRNISHLARELTKLIPRISTDGSTTHDL